MGYRKIPTIYTFDDLPEEEGLVVRMKAIRIGRLRALMRAVSTAKGDTEGDDSVEEMFELLEEGLISWNLEDGNGAPIPADMSGIDQQELPFVLKILEVWLSQMTGPDPELGKGSPSGATFPGRPLTMEAL